MRSGKPSTTGLSLPGRAAAYTSFGSRTGGIPGSGPGDCATTGPESSSSAISASRRPVTTGGRSPEGGFCTEQCYAVLPGSSTRGGSQPTGKGKATTGNTADADQKPLLTVPATTAHSTVHVVLSAGVIGAGCAGRRLFENPAGVVDPSAPDPRKARRCGDASIW